MLKLYYTGAIKFDKPQMDAIKSLGGYISASEIPNGLLGNMFGDLSRLTIQQGKAEIRLIAIKNTAGVTKTVVKCWFTYPGGGTPTNDCEYEVGFVAPTADACGDLVTEKLTNPFATPYTIAMVANKIDEASALALPNLAANEYLIIAIRRKIKPSAQLPLSNTQLQQIQAGTLVLPTIEDIQLTFAWN